MAKPPGAAQDEKAGIMTNTKAKHFWAVAALLAVGLAVMLLYAGRKQGYHVDELYTYELANYPGGFYALQDGSSRTAGMTAAFTRRSCRRSGPLPTASHGTTRRSMSTRRSITVWVDTAESLFPGLGLPWVGSSCCRTLSACLRGQRCCT